MEITTESLQAELDHCYDLLTQLGFGFEKPRLYTGSKDQGKFIEISSLRDLARISSIAAVYNDELNGIYAANISMRWPPSATDEEFWAFRLYILLHELVHAIQAQLNPNLRTDDTKKSKDSRREEQFETHFAFCEGSAEYIALMACTETGIKVLQHQATKRHDQLVSSLREWLEDATLRHLATFYKTDYSPDAWETTVVKYFRRNPGVVSQVFSYTIGYHFMTCLAQLRKLDVDMLKSVIQNPPKDYIELLRPDKYLGRITKRPI